MIRASAPYTSGWGSFVLLKMDCVRVARGGSLSMLHRGHWDDAYAYVLRSQPDNIPQHEDTYKRNAQVWHYTNARINELIQEAEQALEIQDKQLDQGQ